MTHQTYKISTVRADGTTETVTFWQPDGYDIASRYFGRRCTPDFLFVVWMELGFGGTDDAQWVIVNRYARDIEGWS